MKYLLTFASLICILSSVKSQDLMKEIQGTWKIKDNVYISFTATHFTRIEIDSATQATNKSVLGRYSIANNICSQTVLSADKESIDLVGTTSTFIICSEGPDRIVVSKVENASSETWKRETTRVMRKVGLDSSGDSRPVDTEILLRAMYVIHNGQKAVSLTNVFEKGKTPLHLIPQEIIGSLDILKEEEANALFSEAGKNGVVIIRVLSPNIFKLMKRNGYNMSRLNRFQSKTVTEYRR